MQYRRLFQITFLFIILFGVSTIGRAQEQPTTVPHPPTRSLTSVEAEGRSTARLPREKVGRMSKEEIKRLGALRQPSAEDVAAYAEFLKSADAGIVKLFVNADCEKKFVVQVGGDCENYVHDRYGSSLGIRRRSSGDLRVERDELIADGFFSLSMIADIGEGDIRSIGFDTGAVKDIQAVQPAKTLDGLKAQYAEMRAGSRRGEFFYRDRINYAVDHVYIIRVIAVDADNVGYKRLGRDRGPAKDTNLNGRFLGLRYEDRSDVTAVLKVVRVEDGAVTIVWKRLSRTPAPVIRFGDKQPLSDFKN